ncbi:hypothetical protein BV20DRAFT_862551 [Pilatotrama ljubarskyi]|nr:hypothetical protein BV20DRAFT_862551 [Pilatotrama ljubarskyi]
MTHGRRWFSLATLAEQVGSRFASSLQKRKQPIPLDDLRRSDRSSPALARPTGDAQSRQWPSRRPPCSQLPSCCILAPQSIAWLKVPATGSSVPICIISKCINVRRRLLPTWTSLSSYRLLQLPSLWITGHLLRN